MSNTDNGLGRAPIGNPEVSNQQNQSSSQEDRGRESIQSVQVPETISVRVAMLGKGVVTVTGPKGMTAADALKKANIQVGDNFDLNVGGSVIKSGQELQNNQILLLVPKINGGNPGAIDSLNSSFESDDVNYLSGLDLKDFDVFVLAQDE